MIDYNAIDIHWIEKVSKANRKADMTLVEKVLDDIFQTSLCISTRGMQGEGVPCYTDVKLSNFAI